MRLRRDLIFYLYNKSVKLSFYIRIFYILNLDKIYITYPMNKCMIQIKKSTRRKNQWILDQLQSEVSYLKKKKII